MSRLPNIQAINKTFRKHARGRERLLSWSFHLIEAVSFVRIMKVTQFPLDHLRSLLWYLTPQYRNL